MSQYERTSCIPVGDGKARAATIIAASGFSSAERRSWTSVLSVSVV
nr:hypothetical protein [Kibdelosporangium sp. MJ126-NF4]CTQ93905.1 hypothetical protein [Kibdelosporangium sp. MJ126-NF4]